MCIFFPVGRCLYYYYQTSASQGKKDTKAQYSSTARNIKRKCSRRRAETDALNGGATNGGANFTR
eukprot:6208868-Pleurochrysis_carterae.AAC.6